MILAPGDKVAIIEPASACAEENVALLDQARRLLEEWGLVVAPPVRKRHHLYLAGADAERAAELEAALADPAIRAIFCARGGYGAMRLFPFLRAGWAKGPKLLAGYSDVTALLGAAAKLWPEVVPWHAPNVATQQLLGPGEAHEHNRAMLRRALFAADYEVDAPIEMLRKGSAEGALTGGCLTLVAAALGSPLAIETKGRILFLEDTKEAPYRIDRMLVQLKNAGLFEGLTGLVFGEMSSCEDGVSDLRAVLSDVLADTSFPIAYGLEAGHGARNTPLPLGRRAVIDAEAGRFRVR